MSHVSNWSILSCSSWVVPFHNIGMDHKQSKFLWKCMIAPHLVDLHDMIQFVFEHSSLGSKIWEATREKLYNYLCKKKSKNKL